MRASVLSALLVASAMPVAAGPAEVVRHTVYACADGAPLDVAYVFNRGGTDFAVVLHGGTLVPMKQVRSASGVRFAAVDPATPFELVTKGDNAFLIEATGGKDAIVRPDCTAP